MKKDNPYYDESMWKGAPREGFSKARELRDKMTKAEKILWDKLKQNQLAGYKFRRQHPIHKFIVDFYCHKLKLIIEVDGEYHNELEQRKKDNERSKLLEFQDLKIIRFSNGEVLNNIKIVIQKIEKTIEEINNNSK